VRAMLRAAATLAVAAALVTGCGSGDDWSQPHPKPTPVGDFGPGFVDPSSAPTPEATITPEPGSWDAVHPSKGYRVVLLAAGDDTPTKTLVTAVEGWAHDEQVDLRTLRTDGSGDLVPTIVKALEMGPDLIVAAGNDLVDPLALVTASHLAQQFLVLGAEVAEPTHNVTAVDWTGASFRGEGLGASSTYDATSFTADRCAASIRAGVAAVLNELTGIVIWLDKL
jgi:hypothetical protein